MKKISSVLPYAVIALLLSSSILLAHSQQIGPEDNLRGIRPDFDYSSYGANTPNLAEANESGFQPASVSPTKKTLYVFNQDYPPVTYLSYPTNPKDRTNFLKLLDLELQKGQHFNLSETIENADYRVNIECAGITPCNKLHVYVMSPKRDVLTAFTIKNVSSHLGFKYRDPGSVAVEISSELEKRISQLNQGDYGYSHY